MFPFHAIAVFCGSADKLHPEYLHAARQMGTLLAQKGILCVYGGGSTGMMGALADAVLAAGGRITGVVPKDLFPASLLHNHLSQVDWVEGMHRRKGRMYELAQAIIALPGGFGTFDELFEALTWAQIGLIRKPIGLLNTRNYFTPLLSAIEHARTEGFLYAEHQALFHVANTPEELLELISAHQPPPGLERWMYREE